MYLMVYTGFNAFCRKKSNVELNKPFVQDIDMKNIELVLKLHSFDKFENQNQSISVNVFGYEKKIFYLCE